MITTSTVSGTEKVRKKMTFSKLIQLEMIKWHKIAFSTDFKSFGTRK